MTCRCNEATETDSKGNGQGEDKVDETMWKNLANAICGDGSPQGLKNRAKELLAPMLLCRSSATTSNGIMNKFGNAITVALILVACFVCFHMGKLAQAVEMEKILESWPGGTPPGVN